MNLKNEISDYISINENNGALLITGKWGCGKTTMVKKLSDELNSGELCSVAIISLFGIETIDELNKRVKEEYLELSSHVLTTEAQKNIKAIGDVSNKLFSFISSIIPKSPVAKGITSGISSVMSINVLDFIKVKDKIGDKKKFVLIFDDLERSNIEIKLLLGAINDYTENNNIKTIIIADEEKITENKYADFKEKIIFRTIGLKPDYLSIINSIINNYKETYNNGYKSFLEKNIACIYTVFIESKTENIRTVKSFIMDFERIYSAWKGSTIGLDNIQRVFYIFGVMLFEYKSNNYTEHEKYGYILSSSKLNEKYHKFSSSFIMNTLQEWITKGVWDDSKFIDELKNKFEIKHLSDMEKFLKFSFWELNKDIINSGMPVALEQAYNGNLTCAELISLLQKSYRLKDYNGKLPFETDYNKIMDGLMKRENQIKNGKIIEPNRHTFIDSDTLKNMNPIAQNIYKEIERIDYKQTAWKNRQNIFSYLNKEDELQYYELKGSSIISFDKELMQLYLKTCKEQDNDRIRDCTLLITKLQFDNAEISNTEDIKETVSNFKELKENLAEFQKACDDPVTAIMIKESIPLFNELIEALQVKIS